MDMPTAHGALGVDGFTSTPTPVRLCRVGPLRRGGGGGGATRRPTDEAGRTAYDGPEQPSKMALRKSDSHEGTDVLLLGKRGKRG